MSVLFVCQRNNGRSQMAKGIFNKLSKKAKAESAGIDVDKEGQLLIERSREAGSEVGKVIKTMDEIGVDVANYARKQLTPEMLERYEKVIVILEKNKVPEYLLNNKRVEVWDITDPKVKDETGVRETRDEIYERVSKMPEVL